MTVKFGQFTVKGATLRGVEALPVDVEVVVSQGMPGFTVVGMPDAAIQEARERVRAALKAAGFAMPPHKVVVNLAPGSLKKAGSGFDLPIAAGILAATRQVDRERLREMLLVGELSLDGQVRPVKGMLACALCARDQGFSLVCAPEAPGLMALEGLSQLGLALLADLRSMELRPLKGAVVARTGDQLDFADIAGHEMAKRALQVAAAGRHGILMMGPPGSGKTMLASRLPSILPPLTDDEVLQTALVYSVAGEDVEAVLGGVRPFRSPHHSATTAGLVGGGSPPRPGEITLAHNGVLFLDELPEFKPSVLQSIRQPLEAGRVTITRADGHIGFPANFMLVAAANPCPCGYFGDAEIPCTCAMGQMQAYQGRIGGPLLDRIDLHVDVSRTPAGSVLEAGCGTSSAQLREGVLRAREYASWRRERQDEDGTASPSAAVVASCRLSQGDRAFFEEAAQARHMSGRAIVRTLSVARTLADMQEAAAVGHAHLCEALGFRVREGVGR